MRITRDNYEEFFLLYVDNELSTAVREAVEKFVAENPDLQEEWDILSQAKVHPDQHLFFAGKESLFKKEPHSDTDLPLIDSTNYEEFFLSCIDGEVDEKTQQSLEEFLLRHPDLLREFTSLRQTISTPDPTVVFVNKASLYKKETGRRILFFPWRIAAAALIAGVIGLLIFHPSEDSRPSALSSKLADSGSGSARSAVVQPPFSKKNEIAVTLPPTSALQHTAAAKAPHPSPEKIRQEEEPQRVLAQTNESLTLPPVHQDTIEAATTDIAPPTTGSLTVAMSATTHLNPIAQSDFATQALVGPASDSEDDGTLDASPAKKNKLRGLFRKVTRVLEKNTSRDDDDRHGVRIGSLQFALK